MTPEKSSPASLIASLPEWERERWLNKLTLDQIEAYLHDWEGFIARPSQRMPPGEWKTWLCLAGRGWGKTRVGSESIRKIAEESSEELRLALVAPTAKDARDVMVEGDSGILACSHPDYRPTWEPSKKRLTWPNGVQAFTYSSDEPERLRGPQFHAAWCDEAAAWRYPDETWDMLQFGLRLGDHPRCIVTTTPKPIALIREIVKDSDTKVTRGSMFENEANLAESFLRRIKRKYMGTRLGRQEIFAEILDDVPGALWTRAMVDSYRTDGHPDIYSLVVALDPSVTNTEDSDECGIIVAGLGEDGHGYLLDDLSAKDSPAGWARRAVNAAHKYDADCIVAEVNQGGDLVEHVIHSVDQRVIVKKVRASRGKYTRAEPVAALYEQGLIHHIGRETDDLRKWDALEDQLFTFVPGALTKSPDRLDALVWAFTFLMVDNESQDAGIIVQEPLVRISQF